jgi:hypothetical protein
MGHQRAMHPGEAGTEEETILRIRKITLYSIRQHALKHPWYSDALI